MNNTNWKNYWCLTNSLQTSPTFNVRYIKQSLFTALETLPLVSRLLYKLQEADCQETNKSAKCKACSDGEFSLYHNQATRCHPCTISCTDRNSQLVENCTTRSDSHCQCNDGYYMKYRSAVESYCDLHSKCLPGFYVQKLGQSFEYLYTRYITQHTQPIWFVFVFKYT